MADRPVTLLEPAEVDALLQAVADRAMYRAKRERNGGMGAAA
jgi:hypothetical protein